MQLFQLLTCNLFKRFWQRSFFFYLFAFLLRRHQSEAFKKSADFSKLHCLGKTLRIFFNGTIRKPSIPSIKPCFQKAPIRNSDCVKSLSVDLFFRLFFFLRRRHAKSMPPNMAVTATGSFRIVKPSAPSKVK